MIGSFAIHVSSNKADAFIVVGIALTVWFFALYYAGGLTIDLVKENHLRWTRLVIVAGVLFIAALLLWQITAPAVGITIAVLLTTLIVLWLWRRRGNKELWDHLKAGVLLGVTFGFWYLGLVMILLVLTFWQTAALTLGLASFGICAWLVVRTKERWRILSEGNQSELVASYSAMAASLVVGVALFIALIATS